MLFRSNFESTETDFFQSVLKRIQKVQMFVNFFHTCQVIVDIEYEFSEVVTVIFGIVQNLSNLEI